MDRKVLIIDGSSLLFRAFYAIRDLSTTSGIATNALYGFLRMYYSALDKISPDCVVVCFDRSEKTFRHEAYKDYKGTRKDTPEELLDQFESIKEILDAMDIKNISIAGYEADDIAGTLSKRASENGDEVYLLTGDRDYLQLVDDNTRVVLTKKGISETDIYDIKKIKDEYDLEAKQLIDLKGLMGDKSDNIPGIPGIGEKTGIKYIKEYESLEGLYENTDKISGKKTREKVIENKDLAFLSRELGRIDRNVPFDKIGFDINECSKPDPDTEKLNEVFKKYEFFSFIDEEDNKGEDLSIEYFELEDKLDELKKYIEENKSFVFKFFYDDLYTHNDPVLFAIYTDKAYISEDIELVLDFKKYFEDRDIRKISYDIKDSIYYLIECGIDIYGFEDAALMDYLVDPSKTTYELDRADSSVINPSFKGLESLVGKGKSKKSLLDLEREKFYSYIGEYLYYIPKLYEHFSSIIEERNMSHLYRDIELPLAKVLADMEHTGVCVDKDKLLELGEAYNQEIKDIEETVNSLVDRKININSSKQLAVLLFEDLNLPVIKKNKTGPSTDQEVLEKLSGKHEVIDHILRYRLISKLKSTYIDGMVELIGADGKIHTSFNQILTATGRISSTNPNLQNIPIKSEDGRKIRMAFKASDNSLLVDADYSQIELRVLADISNDEVMLDAFNKDADIHRKTASEVFKVDFDDVSPLQRSNAKAVNFGIVYGIGDYSLSKNLNITRKEAKEYIENYLDTYQGIKKYMEDIVNLGRKQSYVETIMHRRRYIPELHSKNYNIRSFGERVALNTPIQGSAADIIKVSMINVFKELKEKNYKAKLILQVHDELIVDCPEDELEDVREIVKNQMQKAVDLKVDLKVDVNSAKSWYDAK